MTRKRETKTHELIRRFKYNKSAVFGLILILALVFLAIFAPFIAPHDPTPSPPKLEYSLKPGFWSDEGIPGYPHPADPRRISGRAENGSGSSGMDSKDR